MKTCVDEVEAAIKAAESNDWNTYDRLMGYELSWAESASVKYLSFIDNFVGINHKAKLYIAVIMLVIEAILIIYFLM